MPKYEVELEDGRKFEVEVDRPPASADELKTAILAQLKGREQPAAPASTQPAESAGPSMLGAAVEPFRRAAQVVMAIPGQVASGLSQAGDIDWRDALANPSQFGSAAVNTMKGLAPAILPAAGAIGGSLVSPGAGTVAGAMGGQWANEAIEQLVSGQPKTPREVLTQGATAGVGALIGAKAPQVAAAAPGAVVRRTASSGSRMAAGERMMDRIPERFGATDDLVSGKYARAEALAKQGTATTPLRNFLSAVDEGYKELATNPIDALRNKQLMGQLEEVYFSAPGLVRSEQIARVIKDVNEKIRGSMGEERGMWKQTLGGLHRDVRAAASSGDPAFAAFSDAIHTARLNFLREDLEKAINSLGIRQQRTGTSAVVSPGKIKQWMETHPGWEEAVEKAQPKLLAQIKRDVEDIVPVTNTSGADIPGRNFGSGRGVLGASVAHLFQNTLGLAPGVAEALGAIAGFASRMGVRYPTSLVEKAFTQGRAPVSNIGGVVGATAASQYQRD